MTKIMTKKFQKKDQKIFEKNSKSKDFWICFFAVKRHLEWTYWWKIHEWSWTHLNNHYENAWPKIMTKKFQKKIQKIFEKNSKSKYFWICFFAVKRHLEWTYWWKIYEWSSTHLNNHCENASQKLWPKNFKTKSKNLWKKLLSLTKDFWICFFAVKRHLEWT